MIKYRGFRWYYKESRQLKIQICIPKAGCHDRDKDGEDDDDDADAHDHDVDAPGYNDAGKYDDYDDIDGDVDACSCTG